MQNFHDDDSNLNRSLMFLSSAHSHVRMAFAKSVTDINVMCHRTCSMSAKTDSRQCPLWVGNTPQAHKHSISLKRWWKFKIENWFGDVGKLLLMLLPRLLIRFVWTCWLSSCWYLQIVFPFSTQEFPHFPQFYNHFHVCGKFSERILRFSGFIWWIFMSFGADSFNLRQIMM